MTTPAEEQKEEVKKGPLGTIRSGFFSIVGAMKKAGTKAKTKIEEAKIGSKISGAAKQVSTTVGKAGTFIATKTKSAAKSVKDKTVEIAVFTP